MEYLSKQGRFDNAIKSYDKAIEIKPDYYEAWYNRGNSLNACGRFIDAVTSYDKAIEIKSDRYEFWTGRAWSLYKLKKYEESNENYDRVLELKPDYQLAKDNQKIIKKKLSKNKTYSFE